MVDWLMCGTYPMTVAAALLLSRARRGDDAHARHGRRNEFRDAASPFRRCSAIMDPFLRVEIRRFIASVSERYLISSQRLPSEHRPMAHSWLRGSRVP